jgi:DNA-binding XRE family transcriptional regulator
MTELKMAKDAGASTSTIAAIEDDINEILYSDRPDELKQIRIKNNINPYRGYSEANIRFIISQGNTTMYQRTLWENMESIFQDLEADNDDPWLYDLNEALIREKVRVKTEEYMKLIAEQNKVLQKQYAAEQNAVNEV